MIAPWGPLRLAALITSGLAMARTFILYHVYMHGIMSWVTCNIGCHHIHHLNPHVPFYRLPEAMAALPDLQHPAFTTL